MSNTEPNRAPRKLSRAVKRNRRFQKLEKAGTLPSLEHTSCPHCGAGRVAVLGAVSRTGTASAVCEACRGPLPGRAVPDPLAERADQWRALRAAKRRSKATVAAM